ncbi:Septum site-determining protein MinD [bioreactor metagenome]|uniref:Septum site-determining protein MinD n=1 Tax=bioreactor metagenome TaxID=1076179 RepID=A0A645GTZ9_9ZZZZ
MFAVNLSAVLAQQGKRVALIDLDLQFGDVGIFLDIAKSDSIADVIMESAFEFSTLKSYLFSHMAGVSALCAPPNPENAELVTPDHVNKIISALRPNFDYVIIDMPPAFNDCSIAGLERSSEIYFMLNPDIATLRNAKVSIGVLESLDQGEKVRVVLNKNGDSSIKQKDVENVLDRSTVLVIPSDIRCAVKAVNRGVPIVIGDKRSPIASAISGFAEATYISPKKEKAAKR